MDINPNLIKPAFDEAVSKQDIFLDTFYLNLLGDYPVLRPFFKEVDMEKQKSELGRALVFVVNNIESPKRLRAFLLGLGDSHGRLGVKNIHYSWLASALTKTFEQTVGEVWTPEVRDEWVKVVGIIADTMIEGAQISGSQPTVEKTKDPEAMKNRPPTPEERNSQTSAPAQTEVEPVQAEAEQVQAGPEPVRNISDPTPQVEGTPLTIAIPDELKSKLRAKIKAAISEAINEEVQSILREELRNLSDAPVDDWIKKAG